MRRPLAFFCAVVIFAICAGVFTGFLPVKRSVTLPAEGETITVSCKVTEINEKYIAVRDDRLKLVVYLTAVPEDLRPGEKLTLRGRFTGFSRSMNPGQFDAYDYYISKGFGGSVRDAEILSRGGGLYPVRTAAYMLRKVLKNRIYEVCPEKEASILCNLLLGDKEGMDKDTKTLYQNSGIAHILSISGLHISILGMGCFKLLRKLKCRKIPAAFISSWVLVFYGFMTGMSVSAVRAIGMFVIKMMSFPAKRTEDPITSLSLMAMLVLVTDPLSVKNVSFLLSYGAALGIYVFLPSFKMLVFGGIKRELLYEEDPVKRRIREAAEKFRSGLSESLVSSFGITLFTLPVQLYFFYRVCPYSVFLNLLILPCMSVLVFSGMILMIPGFGFVGKFSCMLLGIFEFLCKCTEKLPGHVWDPGRPGKGWIAAYYALILVIVIWGRMIRASRKDRIREMLKYMGPRGRKFVAGVDRIVKDSDKPRGGADTHSGRVLSNASSSQSVVCMLRLRPCFAALIVLCTLALVMIRFPLPLRNSCTQLYVGQGNCNVMVTDAGEVYVFDAGSTSEKNVGEYIIWPYLKYSGLCNVNAIFISHSDADHMNGALELIENAEEWGVSIDAVYITPQMKDDGSTNTEQLLNSCKAAGVEVHTISAGDEWDSGSTHFSCLHPDPGYIPEDPNSGSMCILAEFRHRTSHSAFAGASTGDFTLLIPGDVQGSGETALTDFIAEALGSRRLDVYITAHHGSAGTTTVEFLNASHPRLAINSAGLNNRYGHPSPETLFRLRTSGCTYLTLYDTGAVTLDLSGAEIEITQYLDSVTH